MMTQVKRTAKEIGEEIRRNEREFEDFLAVSKKEIRAREIEAKNEIHAIQKKTILELRNELRQNNIVPDHIRLAVVIDQFHEDIPIEDIIISWRSKYDEGVTKWMTKGFSATSITHSLTLISLHIQLLHITLYPEYMKGHKTQMTSLGLL